MYACTSYGASNERQRLTSHLNATRLSVLLVSFLAAVACSDASTPPEVSVSVSLLAVAGDAQVGEVGTELPQSVIIAVTDLSGHPVKGVEVRFAGSGSAIRSHTRSDDNGRAWTYWELGTRAGEQTLRVTALAPNAPELTIRASALAGSPASISTLTVGNMVAAPGARLDTIAVAVADRFGNRVISATVDWLVSQGGGSVQSVDARSDISGRARAVWTLGSAVGLNTLRVTSGAASRLLEATAGPVFTASHVVAAFDHGCALKNEGVTFCWGTNWSGQLGRGYVDRQANPYPVAITGHRFKLLTAGASHTCGLTSDSVTFCWGSNRSGQVGAGPDDVARPTRVEGAPGFVALTAGWVHTCGLTSDGRVYCWGDNSFAQLGRGTDHSVPAPAWTSGHPRPEPVAGDLRFTSISSSPSATSTCGVAGGVVYCWGENVYGMLGREVPQTCKLRSFDEYSGGEVEFTVPCSSVPLAVSTRAAATSVITERYSACALLTTQELECWGHGRSPSLVPGARVTRAWHIWATVCGEADTGELTCWRMPTYAIATPFGTVGALVNLHSSGRVSCGISKPASVVYCWGSNYDGSLGDGTTLHREVPAPVVSPLAARSP